MLELHPNNLCRQEEGWRDGYREGKECCVGEGGGGLLVAGDKAMCV